MTRYRRPFPWAILPAAIAAAFLLCGCASTGPSPLETHQKSLGGVLEEEYFIPRKPVDRAYIGSAWSRQFGPVDDPSAADIRTKKERSLNNVQQEFAYSRGIALGGGTAAGAGAAVAIGGAGLGKAKLEGVEVITAVALSDIPFEPDVYYVTEALRLTNFRVRDEKARKAELTGRAGMSLPKSGGGGGRGGGGSGGLPKASVSGTMGGGTSVALPNTSLGGTSLGGTIGGGTASRGQTEGEGLVVAYKLHTIDRKTLQSKESGNLRLELNRSLDIPSSGLIVKTRLHVIEPGSGKSLPRNLLWACSRAEARSRDVVAAWLVDVRSTDPKRKSLTIAFPAYPKVEDCQGYGGILFSRIDPATDRIVRQKIQVTLVDAEVTDALQPKEWDARVSLIDESFNVRQVRPSELGAK